MAEPQITCTVCGGTEFTIDAGSFFCLECQTQSQDIREQVYDEYFGTQKGTSTVLQKKSSVLPSGPSEKLTSWEVLNYVLKGITDELINLGATPELKIVTLQLWASYLRKLDIAFTSVEVEQKPKLSFAFKRSDAEIIYGVTKKQLKEKSWKSSSRCSSAGSSTSRNSSCSDTDTSATKNISRRSVLKKLSIRKKALASAEYQTLSQETTQTFSQTLEELDSTPVRKETPKRMRVTKHTKKLLNSMYASSTEDDEGKIRKRIARSEVQSLRNVTTAKVVAIANIALALTQQDIQVSDTIRWMKEGHISLKTARVFLPENTALDGNMQRMIEQNCLSYVKCQDLITGMCKELGIKELPQPRLNELADRYCLELQLPGEVAEIVKRLLVLSTTANRLSPKTSKYSEVKVMSSIVMVLKLLFSLDDCTEFRLSHTAAEINRASSAEGEFRPQFVFNDWVQYIECRKAVVSCYHLPTRLAVYGESMGRDPRLFLHHYDQTLPDANEPIKKYALKKLWVESMKRCLQNLLGQQAGGAQVKFPASLTPLLTCTQHLLSQHAELIMPARHLLQQDFTSHSIDYLISPDHCIAVGLANDLNIVQLRGSAAGYQVDNINPRNKDTVVLPRGKINKFNVTMNIVKKIKHTKKVMLNNTIEGDSIDKNRSNLSEIVSDDSDEEENDVESGFCDKSQIPKIPTCNSELELFNTGAEYWFCHTKLDKNSLSLDEFDVFAMSTFPSSFLWLLKECSRMICVPAKDLYANVVYLENNYKYILNDAHILVFEHSNKGLRV